MEKAFKDFQEMYAAYAEQGFVYIVTISTQQRADRNLKAHVVQERMNVEFKYVPLEGKHRYMFSCKEHQDQFLRL